MHTHAPPSSGDWESTACVQQPYQGSTDAPWRNSSLWVATQAGLGTALPRSMRNCRELGHSPVHLTVQTAHHRLHVHFTLPGENRQQWYTTWCVFWVLMLLSQTNKLRLCEYFMTVTLVSSIAIQVLGYCPSMLYTIGECSQHNQGPSQPSHLLFSLPSGRRHKDLRTGGTRFRSSFIKLLNETRKCGCWFIPTIDSNTAGQAVVWK